MSAPTRSAPAPARRSEAELRALVEQAEQQLGESADAGVEADAEAVAAWAAQNFSGALAVACSMADLVLPHLVSRHAPGVDVLFLETGYHFPETLALRRTTDFVLPVRVVDVLPEQTVAEQDAEHGLRLHERDPALCCELRKVRPLTRTLSHYDAWVTGVRRVESPTRAHTRLVTFDEQNGLVKINPLAAWTDHDLAAYATEHEVLANPLLTDGYPSIGCAPCTARVAPGADPRSGRWAGLTKTECGIHR